MLQPRRCEQRNGLIASCLLFLVFIHSVIGTEKEAYREKDGKHNNLEEEINFSRVKRSDSGFTTVLLISNDDESRYGRSARPSGVLTSTARTFVHDGTTTEYGTQVIGTTLDSGKYYAQILQTSSRIYFGSQEKSAIKSKSDERGFHQSRYVGFPQSVENYIHPSVFHYFQPSEPLFIYPTKSINSAGSLRVENDGERRELTSGRYDDDRNSGKDDFDTRFRNIGDGSSKDEKDIFISQVRQFSSRTKESGEKELLENLIRQENADIFDKRKVSEIKANKAISNLLPTYTIRHDFAPSGFSISSENHKEEGVVKKEKSKFRGGKSLFDKPAEIKYDTVTYTGFADFVTTVGSTVIVFMPSSRSDDKPITTSVSSQTTASQSATDQVQTNIKTFLSHSPGMITETVPGHKLNIQSILPTSVADRKSKGFGEDFELKSSVLAKEQIFFENPNFKSEFETSEIVIEPSETTIYSSISRTSKMPTEPLATFATTLTKTFETGNNDKPLGLLRSIGGTKINNGTTTLFTSLIYGTYVGGSYAKILKTSSNVYYLMKDSASISATEVVERPSTESQDFTTESTESPDTTVLTTEEAIVTTAAEEEELLETSDPDYDEEKKVSDESTPKSLVGGNDVNKGKTIIFEDKKQTAGDEEKPETSQKSKVFQTEYSDELITRVLPSTVFKTFTYLTTFFIPSDETTTTSIRSREVVTSDITLVTKVIDPNLVSQSPSPTSTVLVTTKSNEIDEEDADEEFRLPAVRILAPEEPFIIEDTTNEENPSEKTETETTAIPDIDDEYTTNKDLTTFMSTSDTENGDTTSYDVTTESSTQPLTSLYDTTEAITTVKEKEEKEVEKEEEQSKVTKAEVETSTTADDSEDEEVEVIFKTLFTTYTYLTTFFQESTSSIFSSEVVVTNVITSTLDIPSELSSKEAIRGTSVLGDTIEPTKLPNAMVSNNHNDNDNENDNDNDDENDDEAFLPTSVITGGSETKFFDDDEDDEEFTLSPSREVQEDEVKKTPILEINNLKTLYTTYTYYTTLVDEDSSEIKSRTEVVTNIVGPNSVSVSVLPSSILQNEALLKSKFEMLLREQQHLRESISNSAPSSSLIRSSARTSQLYQSFNPTSSTHRFSESPFQPSPTFYSSNSKASGNSRSTLRGSSFQNSSIKPSASIKSKYKNTFTRKFNEPTARFNAIEISTTENAVNDSVTRFLIKGDKKDRTVVRKRIRTKARPVLRPADAEEVSELSNVKLEPSSSIEQQDVFETMVTDVKSSSSKGGRQIRVAPPEPLERIGEEFYEDQISSESNTDEIEPSPTLVLQTSYTTFTYFTTVYKGTSSSDVISRLETITNVVTETVKPEFLATQTLSLEDATLPITYFTTFTYWTTLYKDGNTIITSREETVSNVVTPIIESPSFSFVQETETPSVKATTIPSSSLVTASIFIPGFIPAATPEPVTEPITTEHSPVVKEKPADKSVTQVLINSEGLVGKLEPTTYYTTYTYFTTSYVGESTILKSRLETVTHVVTPTPTISDITENDLQTGRAINSGSVNAAAKSERKENAEDAFPTGLLSTIVSTAINEDKTTLYSTDIFGTFIDGLYAKVLESTTKVLSPEQVVKTTRTSSQLQKTGIVSINEGRIVDADGISTTFFTTKAIGTSIEQLYAQVVESTTSVLVDNIKKSALASLSESESDNNEKTGLLFLTEGSIIQDGTTTLYESRLIGTHIDGNYVQIVESTSSYKIEPSIAPSVTIQTEVTPTATIELTSPSPAAVEGSFVDDVKVEEQKQHESYEESEEDGDEEGSKGRVRSRLTFQSKKRTFTPVIRPFASRNRPTFLPKKKPLGTTGAQTITRANFTPTITATLATKTEGFGGSNRNRFGSSRRSSSSVPSLEVKATASSGRKFGRNRSSFSYSSPTLSSSFAATKGRGTSARVSATPTFNLNLSRGRNNFKTSSRAFNFENGAVRPSVLGGRQRIKPTLSHLPGRGSPGATSSTNLPNDKVNDLASIVTEEDEEAFTAEDEDELISTTPLTTPPTTEDPNLARRNNNPLLRFRRPVLPKTPKTTTTPKPATTQAPKRGILAGRNNRLQGFSANSTPRSSGRTPVNIGRNTLPNRSRTGNNLFPPRVLLKKPIAQDAEKEEEDFLDEEEDIEFEDSNFEESSAKEVETNVEDNAHNKNIRGRDYNPVQIRPFNFQRRSKRQAVEYGSRKLSSDSGSYRFRRPPTKHIQAQERIDYYDDEGTSSEPPKTSRTGRIYTPRNKGQSYQTPTTNPPSQARIRPTPASSQNSPRAPFTIREKDTSTHPRSSNFRRGQSSPRRKSNTYKSTDSPVTRKSSSRNRGQIQNQALNDLSRSNQRRGYSNSRKISSSRSRGRFGDSEDSFTYQPAPFDGTITVTHKIPSEVTIPIVSGKITEYRNVLTAKPSTEVVGPHQYTVTSTNGGTVLFLTREVSETLNNGVTEVTKFLIHETPTTSVVFTPTTIRGRKTSFSHIIPSTVYEVENVVVTLQPQQQIATNAPLANILLSQLLLGNLNVPPNQPLGIPQPLTLPTPTTEYKTRTTTYVTSVTDQISTVLPITFRGKEILTTIVDDTVNVITATEYITDTVVVTPSLSPNQQINSLLLPALLQAQLLNPNQHVTPPQFPIPSFSQLPFTNVLGLDQLKFEALQPQDIKIEDLTDEKLKPSRDNDIRLERESDASNPEGDEEEFRISQRSKNRKISERKRVEPEAAKEIVTLYVSGRRPGEFSTILSTVTAGETTAAVRKREAAMDDIERLLIEASKTKQEEMFPSQRLTLEEKRHVHLKDQKEPNYLDYYVTPGMTEVFVPVESREINSETQSLESVLGDISKHASKSANTTPTTKSFVKSTRNDYSNN